ncbi:MAG: hypothetical protein HY791_04060 [Deltaproteobacteria bacterium]|nr:hypothetical protein [Deltaproteobacteria bacterium]
MNVIARREGYPFFATTGAVTERVVIGGIAPRQRSGSSAKRLVAPPIPQPPPRRVSGLSAVPTQGLPIAVRAACERTRPEQAALMGATQKVPVSGAPAFEARPETPKRSFLGRIKSRNASLSRNPIRLGQLSASTRLRPLAASLNQALEDAFESEAAELKPLCDAIDPNDALELFGMLAHLSGKLVIDLHLKDPKDERIVAAASLACEENESALAEAARTLLKKLIAKARVTL